MENRTAFIGLMVLALACDVDDAEVEAGGGTDSVEAGNSEAGDDDGSAAGVPGNAYCAEVSDWDASWADLEDNILALVNEVRRSGANCGAAGNFGPTEPLSMDPALRCAARKHSKDMADRAYFDHTSPDGQSPWDRFELAGYSYTAAGENIAAGSPGAEATMQQWLGSDGHCSNIMSPSFTEIGVGYYPGGQYGHLWTQTFADL